jgi:Holliday junction resolvasome RuvABC endonuclease subunit
MTSVVGIDPSLTGTGLALPNGDTWTASSSHYTGDERLGYIHRALISVIDGHNQTMQPIDLAVVEDLPTHAQGAGKTGMAQGVVRLTLVETLTPYVLVTAATLKKFATGKGNATKPDMRMALYKRAGIDLKDDNQVDAWWLRALGHQLLGDPLLDLPQTHLVALAKVEWTPPAKDGAA